jgi:hypothetical protein
MKPPRPLRLEIHQNPQGLRCDPTVSWNCRTPAAVKQAPNPFPRRYTFTVLNLAAHKDQQGHESKHPQIEAVQNPSLVHSIRLAIPGPGGQTLVDFRRDAS